MDNNYTRFKWQSKFNNLQIYGAPEKMWIRKFIYIFSSPEIGTFSYKATNHDEIAKELSVFLNIDSMIIINLMKELENDIKLRFHFLKTAIKRPFSNSLKLNVGRYLTNYVCIRVLKPELVIEAGVEKGIGSLIYAQAMSINGNGSFLQFDIDRDAGQFYNSKLLVGDCLEILQSLDIFEKFIYYISDSVYGNEYSLNEILQLNKITNKFIYSQNSNWAETVETVSKDKNRKYQKVQVETNHFLEQKYGVTLGDLGLVSALN